MDTATGSTRRTAASAYLIYRVARAQGAPSEVLLSGCGGLDEATMSRPESVLTTAQELRLIENVLAAVDNPAIGVDIGRRHTPGSFGLLGFGWLSSPTVLSAIELAVTFRPLTNVFALPRMRFEHGHLIATLPPLDVPVPSAHFLADLWVAMLAALLRALAPGHPVFRGVTLPRPTPTNEKPWTTALGVRPRFDAAETTVVIDRDTLAHRLPTADPQARAYCEQRCAELLTRYAAGPGVAAAVREQLVGHHGRLPTQREVARALGVSERTLHRQLTDEGASFRQLRDAVLRTLAEGMIAAHPELTLTQISATLGYDHPASFTRAYRRWTGQPPSEARLTCHEDETSLPPNDRATPNQAR